VRRETIRTVRWVQSKAASVADEIVVPAARTGKAVLISPPDGMRVMIMRPRARVRGCGGGVSCVSCRAVNAVIINGTNLTALISMQSMNPSAFFSPCNDEIHRVRSKPRRAGAFLSLLYPLVEVKDLGPVLFEPTLLVAAHQTFLALLLQIAVELVRSRDRHNTKQRGVSVVREQSASARGLCTRVRGVPPAACPVKMEKKNKILPS